jgi:hypothetical protein
MKRLLVGMLLAALMSTGCATFAPKPAPVIPAHAPSINALAAHADAGVYIAGTLATLGSFEWDSAPLSNHAATAIHEAAVAYQQGRITESAGQSVVDTSIKANNLIVKANTLCAQNPKTGKCSGNEPQARKLLDQARGLMASIP